MANQVEIINLALSHIGIAPIASISEASVQAQTAMRCWDSARKESLRGHDWAFATVVATLSYSTTLATLTTSGLYAGEWVYAYQYPSNCVAMWHLYNEVTENKDLGEEFREIYDAVNSQKVLVSNCVDALGEYTFDVTDPSFYDANFVTMFSYRLAADLAMPLTGDPNLSVTMMKVFNELMNDAERMSAYENNPGKQTNESSRFIDAR